MGKFKITVDPKTIGDMELEYLSEKEKEIRWEKVREAIKNNEQPYEIVVEIEDDPFLDNMVKSKALISYSMVVMDYTKNKTT